LSLWNDTPARASLFLCCSDAAPLALPSFPTRRSSDLPRSTFLADPAQISLSGDLNDEGALALARVLAEAPHLARLASLAVGRGRSEEHTSELQSQSNLVCRLLLEKKKTRIPRIG